MGDLKTRYYTITVTATDSAGNTGSDTCRVIIVPSCKSQDPGCEKYDKSDPYEKYADSYYYSIAAVEDSVALSEVLYENAQQELTWKSGLKTPQAPKEILRSGKSAKQSPAHIEQSMGTNNAGPRVTWVTPFSQDTPSSTQDGTPPTSAPTSKVSRLDFS